MKKIGIITQMTTNSVNSINYGNKLQAYALNTYLNNEYKDYNAYTIILDKNEKYQITKNKFIYFIYYNLINKKSISTSSDFSYVNVREKLFSDFIDNYIKLKIKNMTWTNLKKSNFDYFIVGSDIVWSQSNHLINRIKFLDFKSKKEVKKISYAPSFGRDYIPNNNIKYIKKYLKDFDKISVREKSSVQMLNKIGIENVSHVCDPTLLLDKNDWSKIEENPKITNDKYIFVYLLGKSVEQREYITKFAKRKKLKIINIPYADGKYNDYDKEFGDYQYNECSVGNWLWLIKNAEYVFTDSFHGLVLSTIYEKKCIVVKRIYSVDINNRIIDFLKTIHQEDKFINLENNCKIDSLKWDYNEINKILKTFISSSKKFLNDALKEE